MCGTARLSAYGESLEKIFMPILVIFFAVEKGVNMANKGKDTILHTSKKNFQKFSNQLKTLENIIFPNTIVQYTNLINKDPNNPQLYFQRSLVFISQLKYEEAIKDIKYSLQLDETNISALNIYSIFLDNQGKFKEAIETINKAIKYIKNDQEQSSNKQEHVFQITDFLKPTFCDECHKLLLGFRKQGYQCLYCKINVHMNCSKNIELKCSFKTNLSLNNLEKRKHNFELHTFKKLTKCNKCNKLLWGFYNQGFQCKQCKLSFHFECKDSLQENDLSCHFFNNQLSENFPFTILINLYYIRGTFYLHDSDYNKSIKDFNKTLKMINNYNLPNSEELNKKIIKYIYLNRGIANFYSDNLNECIEDLSIAIQLGLTNESQLFEIRSIAYQLQGKLELAEKDRLKAKVLDPTIPLEIFPYKLPRDIILEIIKFLPPKDLLNTMLTCKIWKELIYTSLYYQQLLTKKKKKNYISNK